MSSLTSSFAVHYSHKKRKDNLETRAVVQNFNNKLEFLRLVFNYMQGFPQTWCWRTRNSCIKIDDFDAVLDIIKSDFLEYGDEFQQDMNLAVEKLPTINNSPSYPCSFCAKVCLGGLTRHTSTKHYLETVEPNTKVKKMLHPDIFYDIIQNSVKKLAQDKCYPEEI